VIFFVILVGIFLQSLNLKKVGMKDFPQCQLRSEKTRKSAKEFLIAQ